jgi:flagellar FliL protein
MAETNEKEETKASPLKSPIVIIGIILMLLGVGVGAYFFFSSKEGKNPKAQEAHATKEGSKEPEGAHSEAEAKVFYFDMPDMLINLVSNNKKGNYLKVSISVEFPNSQTLEKIKTFRPRIVDQYQVFLRSLRLEELRGSAGLERIREELLRRTNLIVAPDKVTNILFREILVQ